MILVDPVIVCGDGENKRVRNSLAVAQRGPGNSVGIATD